MIKPIADANADWQASAIAESAEACSELGLCPVCVVSHPCLCEQARNLPTPKQDRAP